jgi:hypothetical protein
MSLLRNRLFQLSKPKLVSSQLLLVPQMSRLLRSLLQDGLLLQECSFLLLHELLVKKHSVVMLLEVGIIVELFANRPQLLFFKLSIEMFLNKKLLCPQSQILLKSRLLKI